MTSQTDAVNLTALARRLTMGDGNPDTHITNWLTDMNTLEYLGLWEQHNNPRFDTDEYARLRREAVANTFILTPAKWVTGVNAIGMRVNGRQVLAHPEVALDFAVWISPTFRLDLFHQWHETSIDMP